MNSINLQELPLIGKWRLTVIEVVSTVNGDNSNDRLVIDLIKPNYNQHFIQFLREKEFIIHSVNPKLNLTSIQKGIYKLNYDELQLVHLDGFIEEFKIISQNKSKILLNQIFQYPSRLMNIPSSNVLYKYEFEMIKN